MAATANGPDSVNPEAALIGVATTAGVSVLAVRVAACVVSSMLGASCVTGALELTRPVDRVNGMAPSIRWPSDDTTDHDSV